ncbi:ACT domain-containing protein [Xylariomycetidae sp. FL0641]|nr:ACT domain-containing protein [Xylariomycetidae sp. FL0641]
MNAQISFLEGTFSLIHIPLSLYPTFLQPILQVLLPQGGDGCPNAEEIEGLSIDNHHGFLNISITPVECSVVCHSSWATHVFEPVIARLPRDVCKSVTISKDTYLVLSVISAGMDAGSRVMELTSPLALAGIPIFFITTYYSDFILVPAKDRTTVVQALLARHFEFLEDEAAFVSPTAISHVRGKSSGSGSSGASTISSDVAPPTPPPSSVVELQTRTFDLLRKRHVVPYLSPDLSLVQCSGRDISEVVDYSARHHHHTNSHASNGHDTSRHNCWLDSVDTRLYTSLISVLATTPRFLSITLAQDDAPSLLLDKTLLPAFGDALLVGDVDGAPLVPIFLDLNALPLEATGIVSGVAGRLVDAMSLGDGEGAGELSYLSTARAGAVILSGEQSVRALDVLLPLLAKE